MKPKVVIVGAGGIGKAVGLILANQTSFSCDISFGDINQDALSRARRYIGDNMESGVQINEFMMPPEDSNEQMDQVFEESDVVLDCLPGSEAPRIARLAKKFGLHYANLTEYVNETLQVIEIAKGADTAFVLQTGLAPGFINVLACRIFEEFAEEYEVNHANRMEMKVGALSQHAESPHYYAFTWSPIGVATEYLRDAYIVRNFERVKVTALSGRQKIIINGKEYEDNYTSGGAADLPVAFAGKVANLDYKTLRYPGHYEWVETALSTIPREEEKIKYLEKIMVQNIPTVEDDVVVIYASVTGQDKHGRLRRKEKSYHIYPTSIGSRRLRAIQSTTASAICEVARLMLLHQWKGPVLQSEIPAEEFLNGPFVSSVYGMY